MPAVSFARFRQDFYAVIENLVGRRLDYSQLYPATVVSQSGNTLELLPDSLKIRGNGMAQVPIRHGLPGVSVTVSTGARVRVGFESEDPSKPFAALWDTDAAFVTINLGLAADAKFVALSNLVKTELDAIRTYVNAHTHITTATVSGGLPGVLALPTPAMLPIGDVAAAKVKAE